MSDGIVKLLLTGAKYRDWFTGSNPELRGKKDMMKPSSNTTIREVEVLNRYRKLSRDFKFEKAATEYGWDDENRVFMWLRFRGTHDRYN
jgi:hypothetical protein